ncbi:MAG: hypothetical protein U1A78_42085 [Polyangia bacterium]
MGRSETHLCTDCGQALGSRAALLDHGRSCPVKHSAELRRIQEQFEWQRGRIERWIQESYRSAARAFAAYHNGETEHGQRQHQWLAEDFLNTVRDLEHLGDAVSAASKVHFPRLSKLRSDVGLLVEQAQDLTAILATLNREYGART